MDLEIIVVESRVAGHAYGQGGARLAECISAHPQARCHVHPRMEDAASAALDALREGETLLFSPSFASYDEFRNFRDRARRFRSMCHERACAGETRDRESLGD